MTRIPVQRTPHVWSGGVDRKVVSYLHSKYLRQMDLQQDKHQLMREHQLVREYQRLVHS